MPSRSRRLDSLRKPRGEVCIASRSERPDDVGRVTRAVIAPALIDVLLEETAGVEGEA
jgi:hypothetical protein